MPQVFGADQINLVAQSSLWIESGISEQDIEKLTHPDVAAEARSRGLVPLRMGRDPMWHHPDTGQWLALAPAHSGDFQGRRVKNDIAGLRRNFPTEEETARAARTPEQIEADVAAAVQGTKTKKQQQIDSVKRRREQEALKAFREKHAPFRSISEVQAAFDARNDKAKSARPNETVEDFAQRLSEIPVEHRQKIHRALFPEKYNKG